MRIVFFLLLALSLSMACNGSVSQYVPAVIGDGGGIVNVTVSVVPGEGNVYVSISPRTGPSTQDSIEDAVSYAYMITGQRKNCDVIVNFDDGAASFVEGPSAGTALAVMTYAALENKTLREDTVITGTVDPVGNVGPVGGLYEKAKGAASIGADYFITPVENFYEMLLLKNVEEDYGIEVIEAKYVTDVIAFMTENKTIEQQDFESRNREIPDLPQYKHSPADFKEVAERMVELEKDVLALIEGDDEESRQIKEFFENEIRRQKSLIEQGYLFSGANEAFLNYIDLWTINAILENDADLKEKEQEIEDCLGGISRPAMTDENFQWVVGADLRQQWAWERLESLENASELLHDEKFVKHNEMMYSQAWCNVATELLAAAPDGGKEIDESLWGPLALGKLQEARSVASIDTAPKLAMAEDSYKKGLYGAAIYDAVYVIEMEHAWMDIASDVELEDEAEYLLDEERESLWGGIYQSHGAFLYELNETEVAYETLMLAAGLEEATAEMKELAVAGEEPPSDEWVYLLLALATIFLLVILVITLRRLHGPKRNRKDYRTRQKKGKPRI